MGLLYSAMKLDHIIIISNNNEVDFWSLVSYTVHSSLLHLFAVHRDSGSAYCCASLSWLYWTQKEGLAWCLLLLMIFFFFFARWLMRTVQLSVLVLYLVRYRCPCLVRAWKQCSVFLSLQCCFFFFLPPNNILLIMECYTFADDNQKPHVLFGCCPYKIMHDEPSYGAWNTLVHK